MQRLEVSDAVRTLYVSLGVKGLTDLQKQLERITLGVNYTNNYRQVQWLPYRLKLN